MDQLKTILAQVKKYHFWVLCAIVIVVPLGVSFAVTGQLAKNTTTRASELKGAYDQVKQLAQAANPPNAESKQVVAKSQGQLTDEVYNAWYYLYDVQAQRNQWPSVLGNEFLSHIRALPWGAQIEQPDREWYGMFIKKHIPKLFLEKRFNPQDPKDEGGLSVRMTQEEKAWYEARVSGAAVPSTFKKKSAPEAKSDPAKPPAAKDATSPDAGGAKTAVIDEIQGIVDWDPGDRQRLEDRYLWQKPPTSTQLWLAQEDLWVLEALVRVLKRTNQGATSQYNAPIKRIESVAIGQDAAAAFASSQDRIFRGFGGAFAPGMGGYGPPGMTGPGGYPGAGGYPGPSGAAPPGGVTPPGGGGPSAGPMMGPKAPTGASSDAPGVSAGLAAPGGAPLAGLSEDEQMAMVLKNGRYVDQNGQPLAYGVTPPFAELKMMPVYMRLSVDQRALPRLLAECANASMTVVIRRVSIRPEEGKQLDLSGMSGGSGIPGMSGPVPPGTGGPGATSPSMNPYASGPKGGAPYGGSTGYRPGGGSSSSSDAYGGAAASTATFSDEMTVEIQGIIYIFNRPDRKAIGTGAATTEPAPGPTVPPTGPTPGPAVPPGTSVVPAKT